MTVKLTSEEEHKNDGQLINGLTKNVLHHRPGDEGFRSAVGLPQQQIGRGHFRGQREWGERVHNKVDPQHLHGLEGRVLYGAGADESYDDRDDVHGQLELQELGDTVVHVPAPHHSLDDRREIVVREDDVGGLFRNVRTYTLAQSRGYWLYDEESSRGNFFIFFSTDWRSYQLCPWRSRRRPFSGRDRRWCRHRWQPRPRDSPWPCCQLCPWRGCTCPWARSAQARAASARPCPEGAAEPRRECRESAC